MCRLTRAGMSDSICVLTNRLVLFITADYLREGYKPRGEGTIRGGLWELTPYLLKLTKGSKKTASDYVNGCDWFESSTSCPSALREGPLGCWCGLSQIRDWIEKLLEITYFSVSCSVFYLRKAHYVRASKNRRLFHDKVMKLGVHLGSHKFLKLFKLLTTFRSLQDAA